MQQTLYRTTVAKLSAERYTALVEQGTAVCFINELRQEPMPNGGIVVLNLLLFAIFFLFSSDSF